MAFPIELLNRLLNTLTVSSEKLVNVRMIDTSHDKIHRKEFYDTQNVFEDVANNGSIYLSLRPQEKEMHLVVITDAEGKCRFKSYKNTTWTADGTLANIFNRYINAAPAADAQVYYGGTPNVLGTQRFDKLILGGTGPQSTGATEGSRIESVLDPGEELTIEITNVSGQTKDFGLTVEWYEVAE